MLVERLTVQLKAGRFLLNSSKKKILAVIFIFPHIAFTSPGVDVFNPNFLSTIVSVSQGNRVEKDNLYANE